MNKLNMTINSNRSFKIDLPIGKSNLEYWEQSKKLRFTGTNGCTTMYFDSESTTPPSEMREMAAALTQLADKLDE